MDADRIPVLRRQIDGIPPYAEVLNQPLTRRREQLVSELEMLTAGTNNQTERRTDHE